MIIVGFTFSSCNGCQCASGTIQRCRLSLGQGGSRTIFSHLNLLVLQDLVKKCACKVDLLLEVWQVFIDGKTFTVVALRVTEYPDLGDLAGLLSSITH